MSFQRSYSKVWWGSDNQLQALTSSAAGSSLTSGGFYSYFQQQHQQQQQQLQQQQQQQYHSLDYNNYRGYSGNLSRIQEVEDEHNSSKLSWEKHDSPGSLRSQDSGFSDNDESHSTRSLGGRSTKTTTSTTTTTTTTASPSAKSDVSAQSLESPTAGRRRPGAATPPTVVRRVGKSEFYSPLVNVSRRISFSGSPAAGQTPTPVARGDRADRAEEAEGPGLLAQLDSMRLVEDGNNNDLGEGPARQLDFGEDAPGEADESLTSLSSSSSPCQCPKQQQQQRRRRRVSRKATKPLTPTRRRTAAIDSNSNPHSDEDDEVFEEFGVEAEGPETETETGLNRTRTLPGGPTVQGRWVPEYNNETVYLGEAPPPYHNETVLLGAAEDPNDNRTLSGGDDGDLTMTMSMSMTLTPLKDQHRRFMASTSTPKAQDQAPTQSQPQSQDPVPAPALSASYASLSSSSTGAFENPLLHGHPPALQHWLQDLRSSYEHEVMSTLQTKSIAQEAFKNLTITTNTVAKLIRQLQQRALHLQTDFERVERVLRGETAASLAEALSGATELVADAAEFTKVLERRALFFTESRADRRRYLEHLDQMRQIVRDTSLSLAKQHYINLESLLDDLHVLRRCLLIALRLLFAKLVRIIVQRIESGGSGDGRGGCDLLLRANINMIATLTNIDYEGFASLADAFVQSEAVRALLVICLDHRVSTVRALALRALATICCSPAAIAQLGACGGIEIVRDILAQPGTGTGDGDGDGAIVVGDMERREAVSLLTQITAVWHGPEHRVEGLRACAESIVAGLTRLLVGTECPQTLLLCAAALNNLSRIEVTSHYSIMSNEAIFKLIETVGLREDGVSIFLYEQIVAMLHNMSLNKKCHSHLANGSIINFVTSVYQTELHRVHGSRAQGDAQRRTIKGILHTLTRLVHESTLGPELLELQAMPVFLRTALTVVGGGVAGAVEGHSFDGGHSRDVSLLARQLLLAQQQHHQQQQQQQPQPLDGDAKSSRTSAALKFNLTRQESYV